jgi:hypothetical protein
MCGRYSITLPPEAIRELFQTHGELPNWPAYYNAAPTGRAACRAPSGYDRPRWPAGVVRGRLALAAD